MREKSLPGNKVTYVPQNKLLPSIINAQGLGRSSETGCGGLLLAWAPWPQGDGDGDGDAGGEVQHANSWTRWPLWGWKPLPPLPALLGL